MENNEVKKKLSNYQLGNLIVSIIMFLNYVLLALIGSGLFKASTQTFFENYFFMSFTIIPVGLLIALCVILNKNESEVSKKEYSLYLPFIQSVLFILLFGVKYAIQLDRMILAQIIVVCFVFILVQVMLMMILFENGFSKKKFYIINAFSYASYALFMILMIVLSYDYSVIL